MQDGCIAPWPIVVFSVKFVKAMPGTAYKIEVRCSSLQQKDITELRVCKTCSPNSLQGISLYSYEIFRNILYKLRDRETKTASVGFV